MKRKPSPKSIPSRMVLLCSNIAVNPANVVSIFCNAAGIVEIRMDNGTTYTLRATTVANVTALLQ